MDECDVVIPYVLWYFLILGSLEYFALYDIGNFKTLQKYITITQFVSIAIYIVFPTTQMRPVAFKNDNIFTDLVGVLYSIDNNTNACPSLHVAIAVAIAWVCTRTKSVKLGWQNFCCFGEERKNKLQRRRHYEEKTSGWNV